MSSIAEISIGAVVILLVLKEVFAFMKGQGNSPNPNTLIGMTKDLWEWHKPDDKGRQAWRDHSEMQTTLIRLTKSIEDLCAEIRATRDK
jgi:hypothetical protein